MTGTVDQLCKEIMTAISACPHEICRESVILKFEHRGNGHNALSQLRRRVEDCIRKNLQTGEQPYQPSVLKTEHEDNVSSIAAEPIAKEKTNNLATDIGLKIEKIENDLRSVKDMLEQRAIGSQGPLPPKTIEKQFYPIVFPLNINGQGPAPLNEVARLTWEVWDHNQISYGSFDFLPDAIDFSNKLNDLASSTDISLEGDALLNLKVSSHLDTCKDASDEHPRYSTKRLRHEIERARENDKLRISELEATIMKLQSAQDELIFECEHSMRTIAEERARADAAEKEIVLVRAQEREACVAAASNYCWQRYKERSPLNLKTPAVFTSHEHQKIDEYMRALRDDVKTTSRENGHKVEEPNTNVGTCTTCSSTMKNLERARNEWRATAHAANRHAATVKDRLSKTLQALEPFTKVIIPDETSPEGWRFIGIPNDHNYMTAFEVYESASKPIPIRPLIA